MNVESQELRTMDTFRAESATFSAKATGTDVNPAGTRQWVGRIAVLFLFFFGAALTLHWPGFHAGMVYDSNVWIQQKEHVFARGSLQDILGIVPARPLFVLSLYANYLLGGMDPIPFRVVNAAFLAAAGAALAFLIWLVLDIAGNAAPGAERGRRWVCAFLGLLFVVHPLQSFVVLYIWQREALMACLFYFTGLALYFAARSGRFKRVGPAYVGAALLLLCGLWSKENVATLPLAWLAGELVLFRPSWRHLLRRALVIAAISVMPAVIYGYTVNVLHGPETTHAQGMINRLLGHYAFSGLTVDQVVLTECRIWFSYLRMICAPYFHQLEFIRAETVSLSLFDPLATMPAVAGIVGLVAAGIGLAKKRPVASYGILLVVISLLPESLMIPPYLFFGYRAVLPMAGVLIVLSEPLIMAMSKLRGASPRGLWLTVAFLTAIAPVAYLSAVTYGEAKQWSSFTFWKRAADRLPPFSGHTETVPYLDIVVNSMLEYINVQRYADAVDIFARAEGSDPPLVDKTGRPAFPFVGAAEVDNAIDKFIATFPTKPDRVGAVLLNLGVVAGSMGRSDEALRIYRKAAEINPALTIAHLNLGAGLEQAGDLAGALEAYVKAVESDSRSAEACRSLGAALTRAGYLPEAVEYLNRAIQLEPNLFTARVSLGDALEAYNKIPSALEAYRKSLEIAPDCVPAYQGLARLHLRLGDVPAAVRHFRKAVELDPQSAANHTNLAFALLQSGMLSQAQHHYREALKLDPQDMLARNNLGVTMKRMGNRAEAVHVLEEALEKDPTFVTTYHNLAVVLEESGQRDRAIATLRKALEIDPASAEIHHDLARSLLNAGEITEAIAHARKAVQHDPTQPRFYVTLGEALEQSGDLTGALAQYKAAARLRDDSMPPGTSNGTIGPDSHSKK
ncbi:MAG: tetratricopeptide repeat protein [Desulfomonile tiedjei]|nr:tetratricopeptide repeat protein [Desulfomonile tiedjei]